MNSEGELANFQDDLLTVHRLARHTSEGPFLIDYLVGLMLEGMAQGSVAHLAQTGKLPARSAREIERRIKALPDFPSAFEGLGDAERFCYLDAVAYVSRTGAYGLADLEELTFSSDLGALHQRLCYVAVPFIDWDVPLRIGNEFFDVLATASDASTPSERDETFARLERWEETQTANDSASIMWTMLLSESPREDLSKAVSTVFVELLLAGYQTVPRLDDRHSVQTSLVQVHLALAAYHADHDEYPNRLDALAPTYIAKLPDDLFTGEPLKYRVKGDTYTLYSVGHDRVDDGGTLPDDIVLGAPLE